MKTSTDKPAAPEPTPRTAKLVLSFPSLPYDQQQSARYGKMIQLAEQLERELAQCQADLAAANERTDAAETKWLIRKTNCWLNGDVNCKSLEAERKAREVAEEDRDSYREDEGLQHQRAEAAERRAATIERETVKLCEKVCHDIFNGGNNIGSMASPADYAAYKCEMAIGALLPTKPVAQGCTRSHPHENMDTECEQKTIVARARNLAAQSWPVAQEAVDKLLHDLHEYTNTFAGFEELERRIIAAFYASPVAQNEDAVEALQIAARMIRGELIENAMTCEAGPTLGEMLRAAIDAARKASEPKATGKA